MAVSLKWLTKVDVLVDPLKVVGGILCTSLASPPGFEIPQDLH